MGKKPVTDPKSKRLFLEVKELSLQHHHGISDGGGKPMVGK